MVKDGSRYTTFSQLALFVIYGKSPLSRFIQLVAEPVRRGDRLRRNLRQPVLLDERLDLSLWQTGQDRFAERSAVRWFSFPNLGSHAQGPSAHQSLNVNHIGAVQNGEVDTFVKFVP